MGRKGNRVDHKSGSVVASDGGVVEPSLGSIEDGSFPSFAMTDQMRIFVVGHRAAGMALLLIAASVGISIAAVIFESVTTMALTIALDVVAFGLMLSARRAVAEAIDSEAERHDEIENYRKLSSELCLRAIRKDRGNG